MAQRREKRKSKENVDLDSCITAQAKTVHICKYYSLCTLPNYRLVQCAESLSTIG